MKERWHTCVKVCGINALSSSRAREVEIRFRFVDRVRCKPVDTVELPSGILVATK